MKNKAIISVQRSDQPVEQLDAEAQVSSWSAPDQQVPEDLFRQFVLNTPAAVAMFDTEMRYLLTSRRWLRDYNLGDRDLTGLSQYEVFPDIKDSWKAAHRRCLETGAIERCDDDRWERPDGSVMWVRWEIQPWRRSNGAIGGLIMFTEVVTAQKQAEEQIYCLNADLERRVRERTAQLEAATRQAQEAQAALSASERRLRLIAENTTDVIFAWDMERRLLYINPAVERVTGYTSAEMYQRNFIDWVHPEDRPRMNALRDQIFAGQSFEGEEFRLITRSGEVKWCVGAWGPLCDEHGRQIGVQGRVHDINARKRAERQLKNLIQSINAIVWEADATTFQFSFVSEQAEQILGYPIEQWLREPNFWSSHIYEEDRQQAVGYCVESIQALANHEFEYRMVAADGRIVWLRDLVTVEASDGRPATLRGVMFDITKQKRLEAQLIQSQKMESIGRLAGGVAHDFNNLLTAIAGYANLAMDALPPAHTARDDLCEIQRATDRAANLTRQLLAFARRSPVQPRLINLNDLILDMDRLLRRLIGEDIELVTLPAPTLGMIRADPGQIEQLLVNLAVNARDAMPRGGKLTIATDKVMPDRSSAPPSGYVLLSVSDTGVGIPDAIRPHVFEPFFSTKEQGKGTGLGLAICYGIVAQAGGQIEFESEAGRGTTFRIYLPLVIEEQHAHAPPDTAAETLPGSETILLVEDEPALRALGARVLRSQGYEVLEAGNGIEALRLASSLTDREIDLLLTDIVMPQMGGAALSEQFRALYPRARVLFMSGYAGGAHSESPAVEGDAPFIEKPFAPAALVRKVREALDGL